MGIRPKLTFLQRRHSDGQEAYEKMFNITNHQEHANQTTMSYHLTSFKIAIIKKTKDYKCWLDCGEMEPL